MARRFDWPKGLFAALFLALGCSGDSVTAPASCPAFCANTGLTPRDTVLTGVVTQGRDSSYQGYQFALGAGEMQMAGPGGARDSRGIVLFPGFGFRLPISTADTTTRTILSTDSLQLVMNLRHRTAGTVNLAVYRLPKTIDTLVFYDAMTPFFQDSTKVMDFAVTPDTGVLQVTIPLSALPNWDADSLVGAFGLAVTTPGASIRIGTNESGLGPLLYRFVHVDSSAVSISKVDNRLATFDTFVFQPLPVAPVNALLVGGAPSSRAFLRLNLPSAIFDSTTVVRATLLLIAAGPAQSGAGDTTRILSHALATDIGPKSPVSASAADGDIRAGAYVAPGSTDTIRVDITSLVRQWKADTTKPRTMVLRATPEAGALNEVWFWSTSDPTRKPRVHVTYVPPFRYGIQ